MSGGEENEVETQIADTIKEMQADAILMSEFKGRIEDSEVKNLMHAAKIKRAANAHLEAAKNSGQKAEVRLRKSPRNRTVAARMESRGFAGQ